MKKHLNTLFVTTPDSYLAKDGETILLRVDKATRARLPALALESIICFGRVSYSPHFLAHCAENGIALTHLTEHGRFLASLRGPTTGNVLLRREQYRWADAPDRSASVARNMLTGKLHNARHVLRRAARDSHDDAPRHRLSAAADSLAAALPRLEREQDVDGLRGVEGDAGRTWWSAFADMIVADGFPFAGRNRRPPLDAANALLSFTYALLMHDCRAALEAVGLDPYVGFLHRDRPGRASLALDLMEEFRPWAADRLVLSLINRRQVRPEGFSVAEGGAVTMTDDTRKEVLIAWQQRKQDTLRHPFLDETVPLGLVWHIQAQLMARHIRGDLDGYPPFLAK